LPDVSNKCRGNAGQAESISLDLLNVVSILAEAAIVIKLMDTRSLGAILVLSLAKSCVELRLMIGGIDELRDQLVLRWQKWATKGSSLEQAIHIVKTLQSKESVPN
jgi:hypothetical protein